MIFEDDVQSGGTLDHFCQEIAAYQPASLDLLLMLSPSLDIESQRNAFLDYCLQRIDAAQGGYGSRRDLNPETISELASIATPDDLNRVLKSVFLRVRKAQKLPDEEKGLLKDAIIRDISIYALLSQEKEKIVSFLKSLNSSAGLLTKSDKIPPPV